MGKGYVPVEKMSKRARREIMRARRKGWGPLNPVTRRPDNPKAYRRSKAWRKEATLDAGPSLFIFLLQLLSEDGYDKRPI